MAQSIVYLHEVPESGEMWREFMARTGGDARNCHGFGKRGAEVIDRVASFLAA